MRKQLAHVRRPTENLRVHPHWLQSWELKHMILIIQSTLITQMASEILPCSQALPTNKRDAQIMAAKLETQTFTHRTKLGCKNFASGWNWNPHFKVFKPAMISGEVWQACGMSRVCLKPSITPFQNIHTAHVHEGSPGMPGALQRSSLILSFLPAKTQ